MSRILLAGSHLGYNLEAYAKIALEELGHSVTFFGYRAMLGSIASPVRMAITRSYGVRMLATPLLLNKINEKIRETALDVGADLLLSIKGEGILPSTIEWAREELGIKTVLWYTDDPSFFNSFTKHITPHYDYIFTASEKAIPRYREIGVRNVYFLPFACQPSIHKMIYLTEEEKKRYGSDVCFVGTYYSRRRRIIDRLDEFDIAVYGPYWHFFTRKRNVHEGLWGPDMVKAFNASKIVLDIYDMDILGYEVSARTFEVTGSGSFLLTEKAHGLGELFADGKEVVGYRDEQELRELIKYYLEADEERMTVAARGHERAYKDHTYVKRLNNLLERIK